VSHFLSQLNAYLEKGFISTNLHALIRNLYDSYLQASAHLPHPEKREETFELLVKLVIEQIRNPHQFSIFHRCMRHPFDYYQFGLNFIRPFIDFDHSKIFGLDSLHSISAQLEKRENVILLANHQTEPDPQAISLMLEKINPKLATDMVFVAGHRVISDPIAIPMSLGRNLLCIYSKKHMSHPPEEKREKIVHNQRTLKHMQELLNEGGYCIYVAPSGGRDRQDATGKINVAPYYPQSVELFWLMGQQAQRPTHFYPLALQTYDLMPPPQEVEKELGEKRVVNFTPIYLAFGEEIDMENFSGDENFEGLESDRLDKKTKRNKRAEYIWQKVCKMYQSFPKHLA
jgi:glycerol-3-phosphate O-acyltransferase